MQIVELLDKYFKRYHPKVHYTYKKNTKRSEQILNGTHIVKGNLIKEIDSIEGNFEDINYFFSQVDISFVHEILIFPIFKGLLLKIDLPHKNMPYTKIESKLGFVKRNFGGIHQDEKYKFWISSDDIDSSYKKINELFPFISFLMTKSKDVRLFAEKNSVLLLISSKTNLFGFRNHLLSKKMEENDIYKSIVRHLNSYFFIVSSLALRKSEKEIENLIMTNMLTAT